MLGLQAEVRDGAATWQGASGVAEVANGRPVRPGYRHRVGSVTKTFVAATVLQLAGEGRIELDRPVGQYLPDVVPGDVGARVTVRMLLNHTSGIGDFFYGLFTEPDEVERRRYVTVSPRRIVETGLAAPRTGEPGARFAYSNTNYAIAGLLLERVTGHPAAFEVSRRIIWPLGLWQTYFPGINPHIFGPHAHGYVVWSGPTDLRDFTEYNMSWAWMLGDLISTPADLDRFYRALLTGKVLRPAQLAQMKTTVPEGGGLAYGLGLESLQLPCGVFWGHTGRVFGYQTYTFHSEDGARQTTLAENQSHEDNPQADQARIAFAIAGLCGPTAARVAAPVLLPVGRV
jgi:D-alanyl-D-alanine carboxypeptidase